MAKAKCVFKNKKVPQTLKARLWSIAAPLVEYRLRGKGAYPYNCPRKTTHPNAYVYISDAGGWVTHYDLELQTDGTYIIK